MSTQRPLFDPTSLQALPCPVPGCQAIRLPNQTGRIVTCAHDLDRERRKRPRGCLNTYRPEHAEVPF